MKSANGGGVLQKGGGAAVGFAAHRVQQQSAGTKVTQGHTAPPLTPTMSPHCPQCPIDPNLPPRSPMEAPWLSWLLLLLLLALLVRRCWLGGGRSRHLSPPGPPALPIVGNLPQVGLGNMAAAFRRVSVGGSGPIGHPMHSGTPRGQPVILGLPSTANTSH